MTDLVAVDNLRISFPTPGGRRFTAVDGLSFAMGAEKLGIVGESGSGKTLTALTLAGLAPKAAQITADRLEVAGQDLQKLGPRDWPKFRGDTVALVMQDPRSALNPSLPIGRPTRPEGACGPLSASAFRRHGPARHDRRHADQ